MSAGRPSSASEAAGAARLVLRAARVITPFETIRNGAVAIVGERLAAVAPREVVPVAAADTVLDLGDATILPGFVDVHIHGSGGDTAMDGAAAVRRVSRFIARHGVTSWLPTLTPRDTIEEMVAAVRGVVEGGRGPEPGAEVLGIHYEGPFLSPKRPGAIRVEWFRTPSIAVADALIEAGGGALRLMTLAPELPGGLDLVRYLAGRGVVPSIGHSDASGEQARAAVVAGVSQATHTFNAMRPLHHRDPGVVGTVLTMPSLRGELIADGVHVDPVVMGLLIAAKGPQGVVVVTDAVAPAGLPDSAYEFDGRPIRVQAGKATLADGTIAGSVATFDGNVRLLAGEMGVPLRDVAMMTSTAPARAIGLAHRKGALQAGYDADLVVLDANLGVCLTIARGQIAYERAPALIPSART